MLYQRRLHSGQGGMERLRFVGVALARTPHGWHLGILHRRDAHPTELLHLGWDRELYNEAPSPAFSWVQLRLPTPRLRALAAHCRRIWQRNGPTTVRYAVGYHGEVFDETGALQAPQDSLGLTCATFVLATSRWHGVDLLALREWPPAEGEDLKWQKDVIRILIRDEDDEERKEQLRRELGAPRFHPTEVAAASLRAPEGCPLGHACARFAQAELQAMLVTRGDPLFQ